MKAANVVLMFCKNYFNKRNLKAYTKKLNNKFRTKGNNKGIKGVSADLFKRVGSIVYSVNSGCYFKLFKTGKDKKIQKTKNFGAIHLITQAILTLLL